jgi:branched-chain amino acid transport system substrate-binding protein
MRTKLIVAAAIVTLVGAMAAPTAASNSERRAAQAKGEPIKIGLTYVCDAPSPPSVCEMAPAAKAAVKTYNAQGGVKTADGTTHKLELIVCNNQNDRAKIADCARQFVEEEVAFATGGATFADELLPILEEAGIAYFGPNVLSSGTAEGTAPNSYVLGFTLGLFTGLVDELSKGDFKKINVMAQGQGVAIGGLTNPIAEANGGSVTVVEAPQENPNWAQVAEQAAEDADVIVLVVDEHNAKAFLDAYRQAGKDVPVTSVIGIITNDLIVGTGGAQSPLKGGISTGYFPPPQDKAWADYRKGIQKYAKGTQFEPSGQSIWRTLQLAREIMKTINGDVTGQSFIDAVNATTDIPTLGGKLPPGKSFQQPEGIFPRIFNNDYWGPLKITSKTIGNGKGAQYTAAPSA